VAELVTHARANPDKLSFGHSGTGGADHLAGELFKTRTGTTIVHVPYKGGAPALTDLVGGRTHMQFATIPGALGHIRAGNIRPLAMLSNRRFEVLPDVPTIQEAGLPEVEVNNWYGVVVAAGTPPAIVKRLNAALVQALQAQALRERFVDIGLIPMSNTPEEFASFLKDDAVKWERIVRASGASVE
jgi:tripartite-type tricarboxylate transporter receptor subunit TctC